MKIMDLLEARRSSKIMPRKNTATLLMEFASKIKLASQNDYFISFTSVDKLGIYPSSTYATPIGIYSYPLSYVIKKIKAAIKDGKSLGLLKMVEVVPFAGDAKFVNVFTSNGKILDLADDAECEILYSKLSNLIRDKKVITWANYIDQDIDNPDPKFKRGNVILSKEYKGGSSGERIWSLTLYAANNGRHSPISNQRISRKWSFVWRDLGISGVVDSKGKKIIHKNEPTQAFFISMESINLIERFRNVNHSDSKETHEVLSTRGSGGIDELVKPIAKILMSRHDVVGMFNDFKDKFTNVGDSSQLDLQILDVAIADIFSKLNFLDSSRVRLNLLTLIEEFFNTYYTTAKESHGGDFSEKGIQLYKSCKTRMSGEITKFITRLFEDYFKSGRDLSPVFNLILEIGVSNLYIKMLCAEIMKFSKGGSEDRLVTIQRTLYNKIGAERFEEIFPNVQF